MKTCSPNRLFLAVVAALLTGGIAVAPASAQSGQEVLTTALERHEDRMEGIENYTVVEEIMGFTSTTYFEREERDGHVVFVPRSEQGSVGERVPDTPYGSLMEFASRASHEGMEEIDGRELHVVTVTDLEGTSFYDDLAEDDEFRLERATFYIDAADHLLRRIRMEGTAELQQGGASEVSMTADLRDYQDVDGMLHPFRTEVSLEGFGDQITEEQREEIRRSLEEAREQMRDMPENQRQMMERMMGDQLEQMESMLMSGSMDFAVTVEELRVNEGPPEGN